MNESPLIENKTQKTRLMLVLLCVVILLQLGILFQRQGRSASSVPDLPSRSSTIERLTKLIPIRKPSSAPVSITPETVWDDSLRMALMHSQINRMFNKAISDNFRISPAPAVMSPPATSDGRAPFDPFIMMLEMHREIDGMFMEAMREMPARSHGFDEGWSELSLTPGMSVKDTGTAYVVTVALPNVDKSDIQMGINDSVLSLIIGRQDTRDSKTPQTTQRSQRISRFEQRIRLPGADSNPEAITASFEQGILRIVVPKQKGTAQSPGVIRII